MEKKFSQGEWSIEEDSTYNGIHFILCESELSHIPQLVARTCFAPDSIANARLIAAAPELLNALISVLNIMNDSEGVAGYHLNGDIAKWDEFEEIKQAEQAIKKATE